MIKYLKFGNFITELRTSKNLTQIQLAKKLHISNKTVSKWENGRGMPDVSLLLPLSEALGVSVTELLMSEKIESENINKSKVEKMTITTLEESKKKYTGKFHKLLTIFIVAIIFLILIFYFFTTFNSVRLYRIRLNDEDFEITNGTFMRTMVKNVFELGEIKYIGDEEIDSNNMYVRIYAKDNDNEIVIFDGLYTPIYIHEGFGYEEYFNDRFEDLIQNNLYIEIHYKTIDGEEREKVSKLLVSLDFANNKLFNQKDDRIEINNDSKTSFNETDEMIDKLLANGFMEVEDEINDDSLSKTYVKEDDVCRYKIQISDDVRIIIGCNDAKIIFSMASQKARVFVDSQMIYNGTIPINCDCQFNKNFSLINDKLNTMLDLLIN